MTGTDISRKSRNQEATKEFPFDARE